MVIVAPWVTARVGQRTSGPKLPAGSEQDVQQVITL